MNFRKKRRNTGFMLKLASAFLMLLGFVKLASAQVYQTFQAQLDSIKRQAAWSPGPFRIWPRLRLNAGYDDNIYGTYGNRAPLADYTASLSLPTTVYVPFHDWLILSFFDSPQYVYFFDLNKERSFNNSYSVGVRAFLLNRISVSGAFGVSRTKYREFGEIDRRIFLEVRDSRGSIFLETARGSSLGFAGSIKEFAYEGVTLEGAERPLSSVLDREEREGRLEFYYPIFTDSSFFIDAGYTEYNFVHPEGKLRDSYAYQLNSGIALPLLGRARGTLSLGYRKLIPRYKNVRGFSGPVGNTSVEVRLGRLNVRLQYLRDIPFSYRKNIFYIRNSYGTGLAFYLSSLLRLDYDFSYGGGTYPEQAATTLPDVAGDESERNDIYKSHSVGIVFRIIKNTGLGFSVVHLERNSNQDLYDLKRLMIGVYLTYDF
jgi:hypothetical protein